jgi:CHASE2 domain-containing sensor protein
MDGGLGLFGLGLFLLSIALLYAREAFGLAWLLLAMSLVSMGFAMSESPRRREIALGIGVVSVLSALVSLAFAVSWWWVVATAIFGVAYMVLWAEFRFPYFQHVTQEAAGPSTPLMRRLRMRRRA